MEKEKNEKTKKEEKTKQKMMQPDLYPSVSYTIHIQH